MSVATVSMPMPNLGFRKEPLSSACYGPHCPRPTVAAVVALLPYWSPQQVPTARGQGIFTWPPSLIFVGIHSSYTLQRSTPVGCRDHITARPTWAPQPVHPAALRTRGVWYPQQWDSE